MTMSRILRVFILSMVVVAAMTLTAVGAFAASPRAECEAQGGTFSKSGGTQTCTIAEAPGNNQGGVTKEESTSQKGSSRSSHPSDTEKCVNNSGGRHCR